MGSAAEGRRCLRQMLLMAAAARVCAASRPCPAQLGPAICTGTTPPEVRSCLEGYTRGHACASQELLREAKQLGLRHLPKENSFSQSTETGARARQDAADGLEYGFWALPGVCQADRLLWNDWLKMEYQTDARAGNVPLAESWYAVRPGAAVAAARPG